MSEIFTGSYEHHRCLIPDLAFGVMFYLVREMQGTRNGMTRTNSRFGGFLLRSLGSHSLISNFSRQQSHKVAALLTPYESTPVYQWGVVLGPSKSGLIPTTSSRDDFKGGRSAFLLLGLGRRLQRYPGLLREGRRVAEGPLLPPGDAKSAPGAGCLELQCHHQLLREAGRKRKPPLCSPFWREKPIQIFVQ